MTLLRILGNCSSALVCAGMSPMVHLMTLCWLSGRKKEKRNLSKKHKRHKNNNTAVKHWFSLSFYCLVLQFHLVFPPEMSASQPFHKGSGSSRAFDMSDVAAAIAEADELPVWNAANVEEYFPRESLDVNEAGNLEAWRLQDTYNTRAQSVRKAQGDH